MASRASHSISTSHAQHLNIAENSILLDKMLLCGLFGEKHRRHNTDLSTNSSNDNLENAPTPDSNNVDAMMHAIETSPQPLIDFAVTQLNAELVLFLRDIGEWKARWTRGGGTGWDGPEDDIGARVTCYAHAALIYFMLVDEKAPYPLNIHPTRRNSLAVIFRRACLATPYSSPELPSTPDSGTTQASSLATLAVSAAPWEETLKFDDAVSNLVSQQELTEIPIDASEALHKIHVLPADITGRLMTARDDSALDVMALTIDKHMDAPRDMHMGIFDAAVREVKMQAYHNVWLPFLSSGGHEKAYY